MSARAWAICARKEEIAMLMYLWVEVDVVITQRSMRIHFVCNTVDGTSSVEKPCPRYESSVHPSGFASCC